MQTFKCGEVTERDLTPLSLLLADKALLPMISEVLEGEVTFQGWSNECLVMAAKGAMVYQTLEQQYSEEEAVLSTEDFEKLYALIEQYPADKDVLWNLYQSMLDCYKINDTVWSFFEQLCTELLTVDNQQAVGELVWEHIVPMRDLMLRYVAIQQFEDCVSKSFDKATLRDFYEGYFGQFGLDEITLGAYYEQNQDAIEHTFDAFVAALPEAAHSLCQDSLDVSALDDQYLIYCQSVIITCLEQILAIDEMDYDIEIGVEDARCCLYKDRDSQQEMVLSYLLVHGVQSTLFQQITMLYDNRRTPHCSIQFEHSVGLLPLQVISRPQVVLRKIGQKLCLAYRHQLRPKDLSIPTQATLTVADEHPSIQITESTRMADLCGPSVKHRLVADVDCHFALRQTFQGGFVWQCEQFTMHLAEGLQISDENLPDLSQVEVDLLTAMLNMDAFSIATTPEYDKQFGQDKEKVFDMMHCDAKGCRLYTYTEEQSRQAQAKELPPEKPVAKPKNNLFKSSKIQKSE